VEGVGLIVSTVAVTGGACTTFHLVNFVLTEVINSKSKNFGVKKTYLTKQS